MKRLLDRVAIVTGASQGIGRAIAVELAREGAKVLVTSRQTEKLEEVVKEIQTFNVQAVAVSGDLTNDADVANILAACLDQLGEASILVNNAGAMSRASVTDIGVEEWDFVYAVNIRAPFLLCQGVLDSMIKNRQGEIINISSQRARQGKANRSAYCSTKAALNVFSQSLREEVKPFGVRVHSLILAGVDTPLIRASYPDTSPSLWISSESVAKMVIHLITQPATVDIPEIEIRSLSD